MENAGCALRGRKLWPEAVAHRVKLTLNLRHCRLGQPLLRFSFLALLLLPPSLSCESKRPLEIRNKYLAIVQTDLENTREEIATLLQNSSCQGLQYNPCNCNSTNIDSMRALHKLTCKMRNLSLFITDGLTTSVLNSIGCPCVERPTKDNKVMKKKTTAAVQRRTEKEKSRRIIKLCKGKVILSAMTECYEMLNSLLLET
ncbi:uncharacterized protein [Antennarius striatus]|uniref:uncharacterized protein isoform X2 n=1 Tax=Antennarius striatus TaxID=241820 RepID=UPI0035AF9AAC